MSSSHAPSEADRRGRTNQFTDIGVKGRKTGLVVKDTGRRDSAGMEDMNGFFSPDRPATPQPQNSSFTKRLQDAANLTNNKTSDMSLARSSTREPATIIRDDRRVSAFAALRRTPARTSLNSPALRVRSAAKGQASPIKDASASPSRSSSAHSGSNANVARKIDFNEVKTPARKERTSEPKPVEEDYPEPQLGDEVYEYDEPAPEPEIEAEPSPEQARAPASVKPKPRKPTGLLSQGGKKRKLFAMTNDGDASSDEEAHAGDAVNGAEDARSEDERMSEPEVEPEMDMEPEPVQEAFDEDVEEAEPEPAPKKRGRPPKAAASKAKEKVVPKKKAKDVQQVEESEKEEEEALAPVKKRGRPPKNATKEKENIRPAKTTKTSEPAPAKLKKLSKGDVSLTQAKQVIIHEKPPDPSEDFSELGSDVRRSRRARVAPLAFWKNEKIVYGASDRRKSSGLVLPEMKEIIRVEETTPAKAKKRAANGTTARGRKRSVKSGDSSDEESDEDIEEEDGLMEAQVLGWQADGEDETVVKVIACPSTQIKPKAVANTSMRYQKIFAVNDFVATGVVDLPPGAEKLPRSSKQNVMIFAVFEGALEVRIHDTTFKVKKGGQFIVPRGNNYSFKNISAAKTARLFFTHATDTLANAEAEVEAEAAARGAGSDEE
ncbi:mitotic fidelity of chromosome transmission-related protein [Saitoella coloradoensis]